MHKVMRVQILLVACGVLALSLGAQAQRGGRAGAPAGPPPTAQATAAIDLTGYWVSLVTEDWRWRMMTPAKGDYPSIPLNAAARAAADAWDPATETADDKCKAYGAGNIMRVPTRVHITWDNPATLKLETDAGTQTRLFNFGGGGGRGAGPVTTAVSNAPSLQGVSAATWEYGGGRNPRGGGPAFPGGQLKVVTTQMKAGYLQRNGVPYSANAVVTEYFNVLKQPNGDLYMLVTTVVEDLQFLTTRFARSSHFKKEADGSKFKPSPCE
jgi:hypothetical protein